MARLLVTGATGFIGRALAPALAAQGHDIVAPSRIELGPEADWSPVLAGVEVVVHLAGLAHARHDEAALDRVNTQGAARLAEQAARAGVRRFILMSSLKAAAERSVGGALTETDEPAPETSYGRSKLAAERAVLAFDAVRPIVLRPPLVHGPDARANFALLLRLAAAPLPLPFAASRNRRSLIARTSLIDAVAALLAKPEGPGGVFYVADRPSLSTGEMIAALRRGLGRGPGLFAGPALGPSVLHENLEIDDAKFRAAFAFQGRESGAALAATARAWKTRGE